MNIVELRDKVLKVILGCKNEAQLENAVRYANLALLQIPQSARFKYTIVFERTLAVAQYRLHS